MTDLGGMGSRYKAGCIRHLWKAGVDDSSSGNQLLSELFREKCDDRGPYHRPSPISLLLFPKLDYFTSKEQKNRTQP